MKGSHLRTFVPSFVRTYVRSIVNVIRFSYTRTNEDYNWNSPTRHSTNRLMIFARSNGINLSHVLPMVFTVYGGRWDWIVSTRVLPTLCWLPLFYDVTSYFIFCLIFPLLFSISFLSFLFPLLFLLQFHTRETVEVPVLFSKKTSRDISLRNLQGILSSSFFLTYHPFLSSLSY